jgi:hypothetical protein
MNFATPGDINGFNHYKLTEGVLLLNSYSYIKDITHAGRVGAFHRFGPTEIRKVAK